MKIAILSGKGGTGKTLLAVNLAAAAGSATYIDCDVEEPNGHLFFKTEATHVEQISVLIPLVDPDRCTGCRSCVKFCRFNALAYPKDRMMVFDQVCHSCGGCTLLCPEKALTEIEKNIGEVRWGCSENVKVGSGFLNPGEASGIPIIKKLKGAGSEPEEIVIIDCPPGSACAVMESIRDADYCLLVAEPTIFGAANLQMVYELAVLFDKPHGVVLNKYEAVENPSERFCLERDIRILERIPYDPELGSLNSNGLIPARENETYARLFQDLLRSIQKEVRNETTVDS